MSTDYVPGTVIAHGYETVAKIVIYPLIMEVTVYLTQLTYYSSS